MLPPCSLGSSVPRRWWHQVAGPRAAPSHSPDEHTTRRGCAFVATRSPWSNTYDPPIEDGAVPSDRVRTLEIQANQAFETYRELYFEGGVSSAYLWDLDHGFAGVILIKRRKPSRLWRRNNQRFLRHDLGPVLFFLRRLGRGQCAWGHVQMREARAPAARAPEGGAR